MSVPGLDPARSSCSPSRVRCAITSICCSPDRRAGPSLDGIARTRPSVPGTSGTWSFPINPAFAGFTLYNQGASLESGPALLAFSNGGTAVLGY